MPGFSIVTNVSSLLAQENLNKTNDLQQRTITRLTSGLRINSSADDAAGLAIANRFRSDISVLRQGIRNAADGLSTLQTIDGGLNNVSLLIDRARTLATQSASGTFSGDRSTLNAEFQSVINEIDRQAQVVGLDPGGSFNALLSIFIGGGRANNNITETTNGSVQIDLGNSALSSNRLGLKGVQALGLAGTDIGTSSTTSVENILGNATNTGSLRTSGFSEFHFVGPGFSDDQQVRLSVNLTGVVDTNTLVNAINAAIEGFTSTSAAGEAFKGAGVKAIINTDSSGLKQLGFTSSDTAFQVQSGDRLANALLGNFDSGGPAGASLDVTVTGAAGSGDAGANAVIEVEILGGGLLQAETITVNVTALDTQATVFRALENALAANITLSSAGFSAVGDDVTTDQVTFFNRQGENFQIFVAGDEENLLGFGTGALGGGVYAATSGSVSYDTITGSGAFDNTNGGTVTVSVFVNGSLSASPETLLVTISAGATTAAQVVEQLNNQILLNTTLAGAGIQASQNAATLTVQSAVNSTFRISVDDLAAGVALGFNDSDAGTIVSGTYAEAAGFVESTVNAGGAQATVGATVNDPTTFSNLFFGNDVQSLVVSTKAPNGAVVSQTVTLSFTNAHTIDQAVDAINSQLQGSNNETLQSIVAVKERSGANADGIRFLSTVQGGFTVAVGDLTNNHGVDNNAATDLLLSSQELAGGAIADISSKENAERAVTLLAAAVTELARIQADVGKGQNQLQFAIGLATTQITNLSAAESRIRDADLAEEAANLTRASIAQQAGVAALAQANAAPQAVLALLRT